MFITNEQFARLLRELMWIQKKYLLAHDKLELYYKFQGILADLQLWT